MKAFFTKYKFQVILFIVSIVLYGNTLKNGYALDDEFVTGPKNIVSNGLKSIPKVFRSFHVTDESGNNYEYRPMVKVTFALEYQFFGGKIWVSHFINILLYFLSLVVLFKLLRAIFKNHSEFILFSVVLIFAFLPVHSEVVASLKNRDVLLSFIFSMAGFYYVVKYVDSKKWYCVVFALVFLGLAFLSKFDVLPMLLIIPIVIYQRNKINMKYIGLIVVLFFISYMVYQVTKRAFLDKTHIQGNRVYQYFENPLYFERDLLDRFSAAFNSFGFYIRLLVLPLKMSSYYGYNVVKVYDFTTLDAILGMAGSAYSGYILISRFKNPDLLWYGMLFFILSISMYLNFVTPAVGIVADRFLFFASIGFCLMAAHLLFFYKDVPKKIINYGSLKTYQRFLPGVIFVFFALLIISRNKEWKGKMELFETDLKKYPESVKLALLNTSQLVITLSDPAKANAINDKVAKIRQAEDRLRKAIRIDSSCGGCYNNLSFMLLTYDRDPAAALPYLLLGFKRDSTKKELTCNIGIAYFRLGEVKLAEKYLLKAIEQDEKKDFSVPYEVLQDLYTRNDPQKGFAFFNEKLKEDPHSELFNVLLGKSYFEVKDTANSIRYYNEAVKINPNNTNVSNFVTRLEAEYSKTNW